MHRVHITFFISIVSVWSFCSAGPIINIEKDRISNLYTFGEVKPFVFVVHNIGDGDLLIDRVKPSCGCSDVEIEDKIIKPGQKTMINGVYHPSPKKETFSVIVTVFSNATNDPKKRLVLAGRNFPPDINVTPRSINARVVVGDLMGTFNVQIKTKDNIRIEKSEYLLHEKDAFKDGQKESTPLSIIEKVKLVEKYLFRDPKEEDTLLSITEKNKFLKKDVLLKQVSYDFQVGKLDLGSYKGHLKLHAVIGKKKQTFVIPVLFEVVQKLKILPEKIEITPVATTTNYNRRIFISHQKSLPIVLDNQKVSNAKINVNSKPTQNGKYFVYLNIPNDPELCNKTHYVYFDCKVGEEVIPISIPIIIH